MTADSIKERNPAMTHRMISIVATLDQTGLYDIAGQLPWGTALGKSHLKWEVERFDLITKKTAPAGKVNTVVVGYGTAKTKGWYPFEGSRLIVLSQNLDVHSKNKDRPESMKIYTASNARQAIRLASGWKDSGHIIFLGGSPGVWSDALQTGLCTNAFITVVKCDAFQLSPIKDEPFRAPELLRDETFSGMTRVVTESVNDSWEDRQVELEFRNYEKI